MRTQITAVLAAAGLAPLVLATPVSAAPGNGVERYDFGECVTEGSGDTLFEICFRAQGRLKVTETRSGNLNVTDHSTVTFTIRSEEFTGSGTSQGKFKLLLKQGREQVVHDRVQFTSTFDGVTCSGSFRYLVVRGELKKEVIPEPCEGEQADPES